MSIQLIQQNYAKVKQLIRYGGTHNESTLRKPFQDLLEQYACSKSLLLIPEVEYITRIGPKVGMFVDYPNTPYVLGELASMSLLVFE
jgi:hypothetical protein